MSYDLHVVRAKDWINAKENPITKDEVDRLVEFDPELEWSADYVDMQEAGMVLRYWMISWQGSSCFWWYRDQILCSNPDELQTRKLIRIADELNAQVVGDDGEKYVLTQKLFRIPKIKMIPAE